MMKNMRIAEYVDLLLYAGHELEVTYQAMADAGDEADTETRKNFARTLEDIGRNISEIAFFLQKNNEGGKSPMTNKIKQLEWKHGTFIGGEGWVTSPIEGVLRYCILKPGGIYLIYRGLEIINSAGDLQAAKDFIQTDFETKIKSCLL